MRTSPRGLLTLILLGAVAWSLVHVHWGPGMVHTGGGGAFVDVLTSSLRPSLAPGVLSNGVAESWRTVAYAAAGISVALVIGFPLGVAASGVLARGAWQKPALSAPLRFVLACFRAVHELVWAWLFVAAVGLSPLAAVLALGIPYGGILGRIYAELLQDVPEAPLRAMRNAGASEWRLLWHGRLPMALPDMVSYTFYRFECGVRSAAILSFIGLGGLGQRIQLSLADLDYATAWTYMFFLIGLVLLVDLWSTMVRRRLAV